MSSKMARSGSNRELAALEDVLRAQIRSEFRDLRMSLLLDTGEVKNEFRVLREQIAALREDLGAKPPRRP